MQDPLSAAYRTRESRSGARAARHTLLEQPSEPCFSVIVPCFNEEKSILQTIAGLREHLRGVEPYELIVVNDGSTDDTGRLLERASENDPGLCVLTHPSNRGYGASIKTGILNASGKYVVITDADGTYPNERIPELVELAESAEMVVGSRTGPDVRYPFLRRIPKVFLRWYASWIARTRIPDLNSGLRVFRRDLVRRFLFILSDGFSFTTTITLAMLTNGFRVRYVPISYAQRTGRSKIRPIRDTLSFIHLILRAGVYFAPMRTVFPFVPVSFVVFLASLGYDLIGLRNVTDKTVLLFMLSVGIFLFSLLTDALSIVTKRLAFEEELVKANVIRIQGGTRQAAEPADVEAVCQGGTGGDQDLPQPLRHVA